MVQMASPWKHPKTGIYYLYRQVPQALQAEMGKRFHKESLRTREPGEAARLFPAANARLQLEIDAAVARVAASAAKDEISPKRAAAVVDRYLLKKPVYHHLWPTVPGTWWLEDVIHRKLGTPGGVTLPNERQEDYAERMLELRGMRLVGDTWLATLMDYSSEVWMPLSRMVLDPLFESAEPPVVRSAGNERALMDAYNVRVREDTLRLHAAVDAPQRAGSRPRARPDMRFRELLESWAAVRKPTPQSLAEATGAIEDLVAYVGDITVETMTSDMLMDYRDEAARLPAIMPRADRRLPFPERVAKHAGTEAARVSGPTLKKRTGSVQAMLGFAHQQRWISSNAGVGIRVEGYSRKSGKRRSFLDGELATLFQSEMFTKPGNLLERQTMVSDATLYWLFVLGCTSGARLEEVGQARVADVKTDAGVTYIDIDDAESAAPKKGLGLQPKSIKNEGSRRVVPIHAHAFSLGFDRYVAALRSHGQDLLFPDLRPNRYGKVTQNASQRANRVINTVVGPDPRLVFHSLRHKFKDEGRDADVQDSMLDQICGHEPASVGGRYGSGAALRSLKRNLLISTES